MIVDLKSVSSKALPRASLLCLAVLAAYPATAFAAIAGYFQFVAGDVRIVDAGGKERAAQKGQAINEGETVSTAVNGSAQLKMVDGGILALRPDTQLKFNVYTFNGTADGSENALLSLVKGGLRSITGLIGKTNKEKLKFETPTAVIGIRGTDHEPVVLAAMSNAAGNPAGTYDKVNVGATSLTTHVGTAVVEANQVGFAASLTQAPVILPKLPDFYRATPAPLAKQEQKQQGSSGGSGGSSGSSNSGSSSSSSGSSSSSSSSSSSASSSSASSGAASSTATAAAALPATAGDVGTIAPVEPAGNLTAVNASGNVLNFAEQSVTTADGQTQALDSATTASLSAPGPAVAPATGPILMVNFPYVQPGQQSYAYPQFFSMGGSGLSLSTDSAGNLTGATLAGGGDGNNNSGSFVGGGGGPGSVFSLSQSGAVLTDTGSNAATGLAWGRWQGGQITETAQYYGQNASGASGLGANNASGAFVIGATQTQTASLGSGSLHWITATVEATPDYLPEVLTGTATYTLVGGTHPTDQNGNVGVLNSASLGVNFTAQTVNAGLNFSLAGNTWVVHSGAMELQGPQFSTYTNCSSTQCSTSATVLKNGVTVSNNTGNDFAFANVGGLLTGAGLNGAALEYSVQESVSTPQSGGGASTVNNVIQGVAAFSGPTQDVNTPFRVTGVSDGWDYSSLFSGSNGNIDPGFASLYRGSISGSEQPAASVVDSSGGLTQFVGQASGYTPANASIVVPSNDNGPLNTINIGTAVNTNTGTATIGDTTVSWGRWAGGTVNIYSLDGSTLLGSIDNSNRSLHWLTTSTLTGSTFLNLPLTGTATYTVVGNTDPTDLKGNVGQLNSATLTADFGNAKINASVNVSFNSASNTSTWNLIANNVPLGGSSDGFKSDTVSNGAQGMVSTVACSGASCGPASTGYLEGHFISGAQGAVMLYGMATGSNAGGGSTVTSLSSFTPTNAITGLVVMKH